jgi:ribose/xylose/arabinose/galactoside ABC-type transport system permease subunit
VRHWILPVLLIFEIAFFTVIGRPAFHSVPEFLGYFKSYFGDLAAQSAPILLLGFGMTIVIGTGGIDLSVGSLVALIACVMASFQGSIAFWYTALPLGLILALLLGFMNGFFISRLNVPPIIATLGSMIFFRGLCFVILRDLEKSPFLDVPGYDTLGHFLGVVTLVCLVFIGGGVFFQKSRWRREVFMLGGNRIAARYAGISVNRRLCEVYALIGLLAFLAAVVFTSRNGSVSASSLTGLELKVIVAVVLGGTRIEGGGGSLLGTLFGVFLISALDEGLRGSTRWGDEHLPFKISHLQYILLGLLLVIGVWSNDRAQISRVKPVCST